MCILFNILKKKNDNNNNIIIITIFAKQEIYVMLCYYKIKCRYSTQPIEIIPVNTSVNCSSRILKSR